MMSDNDWAAITPALKQRFFDRVHFEPNSGCWLWVGADNGVGYGKLRGQYAHRISYEMHVGPIPEGKHLDHLCRVRCCVNPNHLEPVTNAENARRGLCGHHMKNGGAPIGETHPRARLNDATVAAIRAELRAGKSQRSLARKYGVSQPTLWQIANRKTWRHVQ